MDAEVTKKGPEKGKRRASHYKVHNQKRINQKLLMKMYAKSVAWTMLMMNFRMPGLAVTMFLATDSTTGVLGLPGSRVPERSSLAPIFNAFVFNFNLLVGKTSKHDLHFFLDT
jgi:hypothetical protein